MNTRSNRETTTEYKDDYVSCVCSESKLQKVVNALEKAGAIRVVSGKCYLIKLSQNIQCHCCVL